MHKYLHVVLAFVHVLADSDFAKHDGAPPSKIAVVGAGIGGTATAHFLRQHFGPEVRIDVFEKGSVGGRLATVTVNHQDYESGGSIIHSLNLHMQDFVQQLGLKYRKSVAGKTAVFGGEEFVLEETDWYLLDLFHLWWRYGISFIRLQMWVEEIMEKFMRIYKYQAHGYAFSSVEELLHSLGGSGFINMTRRSLSESLLELGVSQRFIDEVIAPIMRVNYGQNISIPAFVGDYHQYELTYTSQNERTSELYDIVVVATPLQHNVNSGISFQGFEPQLPEMVGSYHQTVASIVHGYLNCTYFGFPDPKLFPFASILTTDTPGLFFNSAASVCPVNITSGFRRKQPQEAGVYKVFSPKPLEKNELKTLFKSYYSVQVTDWLAYPHYGSTQGLPPVVLHESLYYLNGIEWAGSAMEMSSVAAKNIALLAYHRWNRQLEMIDQKDLMHKVKAEL
ncbi:prenylcysteine oxidase-like isoform X2 [Myxocyprinus asiaticus]|uniref:prenylcysteine oxidase-like isoform X2 n=1 Tax=Myxocyprinus asiaticus TaxID=70543 RepID=UPI002221D188|nr:prenylcysteine oxidase-like isoform X2 [Myxocyprinus asiaticus]